MDDSIEQVNSNLEILTINNSLKYHSLITDVMAQTKSLQH